MPRWPDPTADENGRHPHSSGRRTGLWMPFALVLPLALAPPLPSDTVTYDYDNAGRLISVVYESGATITYDYDASGNLIRRELAAGGLFADGFESGDASRWSASAP